MYDCQGLAPEGRALSLSRYTAGHPPFAGSSESNGRLHAAASAAAVMPLCASLHECRACGPSVVSITHPAQHGEDVLRFPPQPAKHAGATASTASKNEPEWQSRRTRFATSTTRQVQPVALSAPHLPLRSVEYQRPCSLSAAVPTAQLVSWAGPWLKEQNRPIPPDPRKEERFCLPTKSLHGTFLGGNRESSSQSQTYSSPVQWCDRFKGEVPLTQMLQVASVPTRVEPEHMSSKRGL